MQAAERLRITSAGLVGVGTSAPSKKFEVANGDVRLSDGYTISWGDDAWRIFRNGSQLRFDANGTQALTIDSSQRVGIGTVRLTPLSWGYAVFISD
jgi:3-methyladenine DNA glycosylase Mpg